MNKKVYEAEQNLEEIARKLEDVLRRVNEWDKKVKAYLAGKK